MVTLVKTWEGSDIWVVKIDAVGEIQWEKSIGGTGEDEGNSVVETTDLGYILTGYTFSEDNDVSKTIGGGDLWVVKLSSSGELQWEKSYGGSEYDAGIDIIHTSEGGYAVVGQTSSSDNDVQESLGHLDIWVLKINEAGVLEWETTLGGEHLDECYALMQSSDGGFLVAGSRYDTTPLSQAVVFTLSSTGIPGIENIFSSGKYDETIGVIEVPDGFVKIINVREGNLSYVLVEKYEGEKVE